MPGWGDILSELNAAVDPTTGNVDVDAIRMKYINQVTALTGRPLVIYAADYLNKGGPQSSMDLNDMVGLMEVFRGQSSRELDLILHSPGGQAEACDRIVRYMRSKFDHVRVFIPLGAMSAATMWAMAADEIVMGNHSQVGPIDPQILLPSGIALPAGALTSQFREASDECAKDPSRLTGWLPTLQQYPPGILNVCEDAAALARTLVEQWLRTYMLKDDPDRAKSVAEWLADDKTHLSHSRAITREDLTNKGLAVTALEDDQALQDGILSIFHVLMHTFNAGTAVKIIENQLNRRVVRHGGMQMVMNPAVPQPPPPAPPGP
ncbi:SDH family Clp fold serine proteinase [Mycolicibacterium fortuitum]|uniref:SDH family Clp fold serine proteinase n=1 Tax=Mycolicibacterium fortuitum TaxID=1766 RepID=UPI00096BFEA2|nr:hypothetical protein [Mycolicibacterium fortuitum]OMC11930.1 hypothetical protein A5734_22770 [Mycolicibacterium fortuitum]